LVQFPRHFSKDFQSFLGLIVSAFRQIQQNSFSGQFFVLLFIGNRAFDCMGDCIRLPVFLQLVRYLGLGYFVFQEDYFSLGDLFLGVCFVLGDRILGGFVFPGDPFLGDLLGVLLFPGRLLDDRFLGGFHFGVYLFAVVRLAGRFRPLTKHVGLGIPFLGDYFFPGDFILGDYFPLGDFLILGESFLGDRLLGDCFALGDSWALDFHSGDYGISGEMFLGGLGGSLPF
jgi:hypothetical protein